MVVAVAAEDLPRIVAAAGLLVEDPLAVVVPQPLRQATVLPAAAEAASTLSRTTPTDAAK
jgi:hypothetical protein